MSRRRKDEAPTAGLAARSLGVLALLSTACLWVSCGQDKPSDPNAADDAQWTQLLADGDVSRMAGR